MAFHPYPQLIPPVFNLGGFGPPHALTRASTWPWVDHPASGPEHATHTLVRIRFRYGSPHSWLTTQHATDSQAHSSKGTPPPHPKKRGGYDGLSAHGFRYSFTPLPGYFSPFPHGTIHYRSSGGIQAAKWSWQIHTGFHEPRATRAPSQTRTNQFRLRGYHPLRHAFPDDSATSQHTRPLSGRRGTEQPHNPAHATPAEYHTHTV